MIEEREKDLILKFMEITCSVYAVIVSIRA